MVIQTLLNLKSILLTKKYCLVFCTKKLLILCQQLPYVVKDILTSSRNQILLKYLS